MNLKLNFYSPSIERGGLEKNLFALINSLAEKNVRSILLHMKIIHIEKKLEKFFIFIKV